MVGTQRLIAPQHWKSEAVPTCVGTPPLCSKFSGDGINVFVRGEMDCEAAIVPMFDVGRACSEASVDRMSSNLIDLLSCRVT